MFTSFVTEPQKIVRLNSKLVQSESAVKSVPVTGQSEAPHEFRGISGGRVHWCCSPEAPGGSVTPLLKIVGTAISVRVRATRVRVGCSVPGFAFGRIEGH